MVDHVNSCLLKSVSIDVIFVCPFLDNACWEHMFL